MKEVVFSGIQPSGSLTIGNYLGALKNFKPLQEEYQCIYCLVDLHALTVEQDPKFLRKNTLQLLALYLAAGLDPYKSIVFIQSHVPEHSELQWLLNTITPLGQLQRMTQYKSKSKLQEENIQAGLLNYPVLMASDILLYQTKYVPVGEDQRQHIELTRDLAMRFNSRYSDTFVMPEIMTPKVGAKVMSLQDPTSKMSKSDSDPNSYILILDDEKTILRKVKRAVTDSLNNFSYNEDQIGLRNLIDIYCAFEEINHSEIVSRYESLGYGKFKEDLAEIIIEGLKPIKNRYEEYIADRSELENIYRMGADKARKIAYKTLRKAYKKVGLIPR
ncbi:MAG: tryptophan--tRNA ligase [Tissierellia bacterium]|nr:tryptophan--tRNA ligase [Tissierellia bacterium]